MLDQVEKMHASESGKPSVTRAINTVQAAWGELQTARHVDSFIESMITWIHGEIGRDKIVSACETFFAEYGKVFHDDPFYDARMSYFFNQFLFEHPLIPSIDAQWLATPYEAFLNIITGVKAENAREIIERVRDLGVHRHSVFQIIRLKPDYMKIRDLIADETIDIVAKPDEKFVGLKKKEIFQGFVFRFQELTFLGPGIVIHPEKCIRLIRKFVKKSLKSENFSRQSLLSGLSQISLRQLRHRHVDPRIMYRMHTR